MPRFSSLKHLAAQMRSLESRIDGLQRRRASLLAEADDVDDQIAALRGGRGPGRPRKRRGGRGPGRPPGKGKPGRPPGKGKPGRRKAAKRKGPGLTDFIRAKVKKGPKSVARLATAAEKKGYHSANLSQVIRLMVGKASDLTRREDDTIAAK